MKVQLYVALLLLKYGLRCADHVRFLRRALHVVF